MTARTTAAATVVGVLAGLSLAATVLKARDAAYPAPPATERLLYLRSGKVADRLMLSFDGLAADVYWIRAVQHYGRDRKTSRAQGKFELLEPLLDLTTTLDPHFNIAYRFGAIFLALPAQGGVNDSGAGRPDLALALLEKGLVANPDRWQYAVDAGFIHCWYTGDYVAAAGWFERAAAMPHAPEWIRPLVVTTRASGGDRTQARRVAQELFATSPERYIRRAAERMLRQIDAMDQIDQLQARVEAFHAAHQQYPFGWQELLGQYPKDPAGTPYEYDRATHTVRLAAASPLNPLPAALLARAAGRAR